MMDITVFPCKLQGNVNAIPSKSQAHRLLICAAFADHPTNIICPETNKDIEATAACLRALGANITKNEDGYTVSPICKAVTDAVLPCGESGSTLRFMLPIAGALGVDTIFMLEGRLPLRPLSPLWEEMERMGCNLTRPTTNSIRCTGKLRSGDFSIDGSVSSQFITGILFAMALMGEKSTLRITGKLESKPYIDMTLQALSAFSVDLRSLSTEGNVTITSPGTICVEGDWSNAAFFLTAKALGSPLQIGGLDPNSAQGDSAVSELLDKLSNHCTISAADIPDLIPILSVAAAANHGAVFTNIQRLRLKESDRVASVRAMLEVLGISTTETEDTLTILPGKFHGGIVDSANDHRIAMSAAIAATIADGPVHILCANCVEKSYPTFWVEYRKLGGNYEQYIW